MDYKEFKGCDLYLVRLMMLAVNNVSLLYFTMEQGVDYKEFKGCDLCLVRLMMLAVSNVSLLSVIVA